MDDNYFLSKEFQSVLRKYEEARSKGLSLYLDTEDFANISDYYNMRGQNDEALKAADYCLALFPRAAAPLSFKARASFILDSDPKQAQHWLDQVENKNDDDYVLTQAELWLWLEQVDKAEKFLRAHLENEEDPEDYYLDVATLYADYNHFDHARRWLEMSNEFDEPDYQETKARIEMSTGNLDNAERILNKLLDRNAYEARYWKLYAALQLLRNQPEKSLESDDFALAINPEDSEALFNKGNTLYTLGKFEEALKCFRHFCRIQPKNVLGEMNIGIILAYMERPQEAFEHLEKALSLCTENDDPNKIELLRQLIYVTTALRRFDLTETYLTALAKMPGVDMRYVYVEKGFVALEQGRREEADAWLTQVAESDDFSLDLRLKVANVYYYCGFPDAAYEYLRPYYENRQPQQDDAGWSMAARCAFDLLRWDEFLKYLKAASECNPNEARMMLQDIFPEGLDPSHYYDYALSHPSIMK